eukprot:TRINITY_DN34672_c0_g1_i1.p1 TRINITY_DN34672_c0_g1~~TRINITY_DN34672_c0_g1_i1.p1  ORF type:complete len:526 (+),score=80.15 TRINITY_DN34672_c0_g1_i1:53-1630(+)
MASQRRSRQCRRTDLSWFQRTGAAAVLSLICHAPCGEAILVRCPLQSFEVVNASLADRPCRCKHQVAQLWSKHSALEGCAAEALRVAERGIAAFHLRRIDARAVRCIPDRCLPCESVAASTALPVLIQPPADDDAPGALSWETYASKVLCPHGEPVIIADAAPAVAKSEFVRTFGPSLLRRDQELRRFETECTSASQRIKATVCFKNVQGSEKAEESMCDEWSKYAQPRCRINVGMPYDVTHMSFLTAHTCASMRQMYCPPSVPVAIQPSLKSGSRSTGLWAAMLEGLLPGLVAARRAITAHLQGQSLNQGEGGSDAFKRYAHDWLEHESFRLGCSLEYWYTSMHAISARHFDEGVPKVGLPLGLCPTCCSTGVARLKVVILRSPFARLASYFVKDWRKRKGHLSPNITFENWIEVAFGTTPDDVLMDKRDHFHIEPAFQALPRPGDIIFLIEDPVGSLRRVEEALCAEPFRYCSPLPDFPVGFSGAVRREAEVSWTARSLQIVEHHYRYDLAAGGFLSPVIQDA